MSERIWKRGAGSGRRHTSSTKRQKKILSCPTSFFGSTNAISRIGERFRDAQYSLVRFLFAVLLHVCVLTVPSLCPAICKSGEHVPPPVSDGVVAKLARMWTWGICYFSNWNRFRIFWFASSRSPNLNQLGLNRWKTANSRNERILIFCFFFSHGT